MAWIHVRHSVADYAQWKKVYDSTADIKRRYGWKRYQLFSVNGNPNDLLVMEEFETPEQAESFAHSDDLHEAMREAGVTSEPVVWMADALEEGKE